MSSKSSVTSSPTVLTGNKKVPARLKKAVRAAAATLGVAAPSLTTKGKTYETWMMFEIAIALGRAIVQPRDHTGAAVTGTFYVRGGPGNFTPRSSKRADAPCHFFIRGARWSYELHNSLAHRGASGETHELDLSVVGSVDAQYFRALTKGVPFDGERLVCMELKAYPRWVTLNKEIPRAFFGAAVDLDPMKVLQPKIIVAKQPAQALGGQVTGYWLATSARIGKPSEDFLQSYGIGASGGVAPPKTALATEVARHIQLYL